MSLRNCDKPKSKPLQFKRARSNAFRNANIILLEGQPAVEVDTFKLKIGDGKTKYNDLPYIGYHCDVQDGKSAYQIWRESGYDGTVDDFLDFCVGPAGKSTYEIWLSLGNEGTEEDFIKSLEGDEGKSAFEVWQAEIGGPESTFEQYMQYIKGKISWETF